MTKRKPVDSPIEFDELWHAAGISKSLAQSWTNGRPLRVAPSLSQGSGKGSRHVYALADAYLLALLHLLKAHGFSNESLRKVANVFNVWEEGKQSTAIVYFSEAIYWLDIDISALTILIGPIPYDPAAGTHLQSRPLQLNDVHDLISTKVAVNLTKLRSQVNERLQTYCAHSHKEGRA
jgi:hypothetical protein